MLRYMLGFVVSTCLVAGCAQSEKQLDLELAALLQVLPGTYAGEAPNAFSPDREMQTTFHKIAPIDAPQFGEKVFYYQLSTESADGPAMQMKVFVFDSAPDRAANHMSAYIFMPGQAVGNLEKDTDRVAALEPAELMSFPLECAFKWSPVDGGFEGVVHSSDCAYPSQAFKQTVRPAMTYRILGDRFEMDETLYGEDMSVIITTDGALPASRE